MIKNCNANFNISTNFNGINGYRPPDHHNMKSVLFCDFSHDH
jgi:hypothetical protein